jgi:hypothetical protein
MDQIGHWESKQLFAVFSASFLSFLSSSENGGRQMPINLPQFSLINVLLLIIIIKYVL